MDPVPENPEADSNRLFTIWSAKPEPAVANVPARTNGRAPISVVAIHVQPTVENTWRLRISPSDVKCHSKPPTASATEPDIVRATVSMSVVTDSSPAQTSMASDIAVMEIPVT